jgi:hypothetical protein
MNINEEDINNIKLCAQEVLCLASELKILEEKMFLNRDLGALLLNYLPEETQNVDRIIQKLFFISDFLSNILEEEPNSIRKQYDIFSANSLFSKYHNKKNEDLV